MYVLWLSCWTHLNQLQQLVAKRGLGPLVVRQRLRPGRGELAVQVLEHMRVDGHRLPGRGPSGAPRDLPRVDIDRSNLFSFLW